MHGKLLEILSSSLDLYISDLKSKPYHDILISFLKNLSLEQFTLEELNYSFSYLFDTDFHFQNYDEVHSYLKSLN